MQRLIRNRDRDRLPTEVDGGDEKRQKGERNSGHDSKEKRRRDVAGRGKPCLRMQESSQRKANSCATQPITCTAGLQLRRLIFRIRHSRMQVVNGHSFLFATALIRCHSASVVSTVNWVAIANSNATPAEQPRLAVKRKRNALCTLFSCTSSLWRECVRAQRIEQNPQRI